MAQISPQTVALSLRIHRRLPRFKSGLQKTYMSFGIYLGFVFWSLIIVVWVQYRFIIHEMPQHQL